MTISGFIAYAIQTWKNKPDTSTPLSAARLAHIEAGIKANSDAITKLAAAVINQQANDVNKIPSSALMYSVNEKVDSAISDLANLSGLENLTVLTDSKSWQAANGIHFALWGANTLGTPYKQNLTSVSAGIQIGGRVSENNQFWISIDANGKMYKTYYDRGTDAWSQWTAI